MKGGSRLPASPFVLGPQRFNMTLVPRRLNIVANVIVRASGRVHCFRAASRCQATHAYALELLSPWRSCSPVPAAWIPARVKSRDDLNHLRRDPEMERVGESVQHGPPDILADAGKLLGLFAHLGNQGVHVSRKTLSQAHLMPVVPVRRLEEFRASGWGEDNRRHSRIPTARFRPDVIPWYGGGQVRIRSRYPPIKLFLLRSSRRDTRRVQALP